MNRRTLKDMKVDVVKHDLEAVGLRLIALSRSVAKDMSVSDAWIVVAALTDAQRRLQDTAHEDLTTLMDWLKEGDDMPF